MIQFKKLAFFLVVGVLCSAKVSAQWQELFNGRNLEGWDTYIGPFYDTTRNSFDTLNVLGLNNDRNKIFSVVYEDGQGALRVSGENFGGISTTSAFKNYHLQFQFKWGKKKSPPRRDKKRDSGLLYHAVGKHGVDAGSWMRSQEFQIQEGDCGEYWGVAGGFFRIPATPFKEGFVYYPVAPKFFFYGESKWGALCLKPGDAGKPSEGWENGVTFLPLHNAS